MNALELKWLVKSYGKTEVLKWIDLVIESWDFFALLGHNGAGKTTTINILTDLVRKTEGVVKVFGIDIDKDFSSAKKMIGVVPQEFNFNMWTKVRDIPVIQAGYYGIDKKTATERTEKYLKRLELWEKRDNQAMELSGGMKRRLMIVRALIHEPKFLILDEPTAGVDVELRNSMWEFIKELSENGTTILLTTHYLEEVEALCNKVAIISKGKIVENTTTKKLIQKLDCEVFVLNPVKVLKKLPKDFEKKYDAKIRKDDDIEITIRKDMILNEAFSDLSTEKIDIGSIRNKSNRIEQLFIELTK